MGNENKLQITFDQIGHHNLDQLKSLNCAIFPVKYQEKVYQDILACGEVTQLAYYNGNLVGAMACRLENSPQGPKLYIITLGVLAPYRSMGVGSRLVDRCLNIVESSLPEVTEAYLHVQTNNDEAIEFYKRFGFEVGEVIHNYYSRIDPPDAVILKKKLSSS